MNELGERALLQIVRSVPEISAAIGMRATWDDEEVDLVLPAITLRTLTTRFPGAELRGRGGVRQSLVEVSAHSETSSGASRLHDLIVAGLTPYETGPSEIQLIDGGSGRFGAIVLTDVQQAPSVRARGYRKSATFSVWLYE